MFSFIFYVRYNIIAPYILLPLNTCSMPLNNDNAYCRQDTVKLCNIFRRSYSLKKDNSFVYLLSFPSLIDSQTKVRQYKGFLLATKNTYPNTMCKDMLEQLMMQRGVLATDLFNWSKFKLVCMAAMPEIMCTTMTKEFFSFHISENKNHVLLCIWLSEVVNVQSNNLRIIYHIIFSLLWQFVNKH